MDLFRYGRIWFDDEQRMSESSPLYVNQMNIPTEIDIGPCNLCGGRRGFEFQVHEVKIGLRCTPLEDDWFFVSFFH
jgi:hypothetical protein